MPSPWNTGDKPLRLINSGPPDNDARKRVVGKQLRFKLAQLISTSEKMLECATEKCWEQVEDLEVIRRQEWHAIDGLENEGQVSPEISDAYETLLKINDQITFLVESGKSELYQNFRSGRKAASVAKYYESVWQLYGR